MAKKKVKRSKPKYKLVEWKRGREWIFRVPTGEDAYLAIQQFAKDYDIKFAIIHSAFMGGFEPAKFMVWAPDSRDASNWHYEALATVHNQSMLLSMSGIIHLRRAADGGYEPFPAIHFVIGGGWDVPTVGGHLKEGTIVKGNMTFCVTEVLGIDAVIPPEWEKSAAPESWYREVK